MSAPNEIPIDVGSFLDVKDVDLMQRVAANMWDEYAVKCHLAEQWTKDQLSAAAKIERKACEGWCEEFVAEIPQQAYFYWIQREGPDVWQDPFFVKSFLRDNPQCARKTITGRTVITNPGLPWKQAITAASKAAGWEEAKAA